MILPHHAETIARFEVKLEYLRRLVISNCVTAQHPLHRWLRWRVLATCTECGAWYCEFEKRAHARRCGS